MFHPGDLTPDLYYLASTWVRPTPIHLFLHLSSSTPSNKCLDMSRPIHVLDNALDAVGNTPLIRLDKIGTAEGLQCNLREWEYALSPV